ncbi:MAG: hypothetical protein J1F12_07265 [Muribaculaceae bacterium]|nr:hypothetical protein [Muribaculaceae bacterium]
MKIEKILTLITGILISGFILTSCQDELGVKTETPRESTIGPLKAVVTFDGFEGSQITTRATVNPDDGWSLGRTHDKRNERGVYVFTSGDTVGVFTRSGNLSIPGGGPIINVPMHFERQEYETGGNTAVTLVNYDVEVNTAGMNKKECFMYYPYSPGVGNINNYNPETGYMESKDEYPMPGLPIRLLDPTDNLIKCRDVAFLYELTDSSLKKGILSGAFYHAFSRLLIMRGEGFDNPVRKTEKGELVEDKSITVVMNLPATHYRVVSYPIVNSGVTEKVRWTNQFYYDQTYKVNGTSFTPEEARKWPAWKGEPYLVNGEDEPRETYYCIIPVVYQTLTPSSTYGSQYSPAMSISYIEMYDNKGELQHVSSIDLKTSANAVASKTPSNRYEYGLIIETNELGVTANPVNIMDWDPEPEGGDITEDRGNGIASIDNYQKWAEAYISYKSSKTTEEQKAKDFEELRNYGNYIDGVFHFYITKNLDFTGEKWETIESFTDILEGGNNFYNVSISNIKSTQPLFGEITGNGGIINLSFNNINIISKDTESIGALAKKIGNQANNRESTIFENCNINANVVSEGPVGILAGSMAFGNITDSDFSGALTGKSTCSGEYNKLFGTDPVPGIEPKIENCKYSDSILFSEK